MRILHLTNGPLDVVGGLETHVRDLSRLMDERGHPSFAAVFPSLEPNRAIQPEGPESLPLLSLGPTLERRLMRDRIDVVVAHNLHLLAGKAMARVAISMARRCGVGLVNVAHDLYGGSAADDHARMVMQACAVITLSPSSTAVLQSLFGLAPAAELTPVLDLRRFPVEGTPEPRTVGFPGRLAESKGVLLGLRIVGYLTREIGPVTMLLSCRSTRHHGQEATMMESIAEIEQAFPRLKVEFLETMDVAALYRRSALTLALPRVREGFGLTPAESLACGRPVVATPMGGMDWVNGVPGVLSIPDSNVLQIAFGVVSILREPDVWRAQALEGRARVQSMLDPDRLVERHLEVFQAAIDQARRTAAATA